MKVNRNQVSRNGDTVVLSYVCGEAGSQFGLIDTLSFGAVCELAHAQPTRAREGVWFANGFHSWSPSWELWGRESNPRVRLLKILERYTLSDDESPRGAVLVAHGICYFRAGEQFICLLSLGRETAPLTFTIDRRRLTIELEIHGAGARSEAGQTLAEVAVLKRTGYFAFADAVGELLGDGAVTLRAGPLLDRTGHIGGWCSWYSYYTDINEKVIRDSLEGLGKSPNLIREHFIAKGSAAVFQIDDGWQRAVGEWEPDPRRFPAGMADLAGRISSQGHIPGLWLAPFLVAPKASIYSQKPEWLLRSERGSLVRAGWNPKWQGSCYCLDLSQTPVRDYLRALFDTIVNAWGFRYLKLDFLYAGMLHGKHREGGAPYRWYREALTSIVSTQKTKSGDPVVFLGCGAPIDSSRALFPLMRIGADTKESWDDPQTRFLRHMGRPAAYINLKDTLGRAFLNRGVYLSDPDVVFARSARCALSESEKELIAAVAFMFGSQIMISDDVGKPLSEAESLTTQRILKLFAGLEGHEYGAMGWRPDLWRCFSRDGAVRGIINLRSKAFRVPAVEAKALGLNGEQLTRRSRIDNGDVIVQPHSICLWS